MPYFAKLSGIIVLFAYSAAAQTYTYETVSYPGAIATYINSMNGSGTAVGDYFDASLETHGLIYSKGVFTTLDLGSPSTGVTGLSSINAQGVMLGSYTDLTAATITFYEISPGGVQHKLLTQPILGSTLIALNNAGHLLGDFYNPTYNTTQGFLIANGKRTPIYIAQYKNTAASGLNNSDQVVGSDFVSSSYEESVGFLFTAGTFTPVQYPGQTSTNLFGINDYGVMVGVYNLPDLCCQGFVDDNGVFTAFAIPNAISTVPVGITNGGVVFGYYDSAANEDLAFIATPVQ